MSNPNLPEPELLKALLEPLLDDFLHWFERSRSLLEEQDLQFLSQDDQADLLNRVKRAQQEVAAAKMLFQATDGQVLLNTETLMPWHQLITECWGVGMRYRTETLGLDT
jgi:Protein of unknown function (DUF2605)